MRGLEGGLRGLQGAPREVNEKPAEDTTSRPQTNNIDTATRRVSTTASFGQRYQASKDLEVRNYNSV